MSTDEYGYPTFGKIYSFIRDVITDDALLEIAKEEIPSFNENDKERLQQQWLRYSKEETKSKRNNLILRMKPLGKIDNNLDNQKRLYTPLALCIQKGEYDDRLWHLALEWLEDSENEINLDKLCFNGSTTL